MLLQTRNIISNSSKIKYPSTKSTALFVVGQERSVYYELLKQGKTINADLYCNQMDKLNETIKKSPAFASRKGIVFHHDNARPHMQPDYNGDTTKIDALGWEVLGHPQYSPDIAPSDYYLFSSLRNYLTQKKKKLKVF
ncbi:histone-lysine N-methyltransferase SETMAR [Trichonephila clavipes]|nr:histone-lysine N-methyltransferase SETMAR [Trichonephila clavipes]